MLGVTGSITLKELRNRCVKAYPEYTAKIRCGLWQVVLSLIARGAPIVLPPKRKRRLESTALPPDR